MRTSHVDTHHVSEKRNVYEYEDDNLHDSPHDLLSEVSVSRNISRRQQLVRGAPEYCRRIHRADSHSRDPSRVKAMQTPEQYAGVKGGQAEDDEESDAPRNPNCRKSVRQTEDPCADLGEGGTMEWERWKAVTLEGVSSAR